MSAAAEAAPAATPARGASHAVPLLAAATAVVVTTEFIAVGQLPAMARDLGLSLAEAGRYVAWFAISAAILGPLLTLIAGRIDPRTVIVATLLVFACGNAAIVFAPADPAIAAVRIIQGAALPAFISVGNAAVSRLAGAGREGGAIALVNIGTVAAIVLAVPAGIVLAERAGWTMCFLVLAVGAALAALAAGLWFPRGPRRADVSVKSQVALLLRPSLLVHLLLSAVLFTAMFCAYTYLAGFLRDIAALDGTQTGIALLGFGVAGLAGNLAAGWSVDRAMLPATAIMAATLAASTAALPLAGGTIGLLVPVLAIWGIAHGAAFVLCQVRVMRAGAGAPAFALSLNISVCNLGIACGAIAGGWIVAGHGVAAIGYGSALLAIMALGMVVLLTAMPRAPA